MKIKDFLNVITDDLGIGIVDLNHDTLDIYDSKNDVPDDYSDLSVVKIVPLENGFNVYARGCNYDYLSMCL